MADSSVVGSLYGCIGLGTKDNDLNVSPVSGSKREFNRVRKVSAIIVAQQQLTIRGYRHDNVFCGLLTENNSIAVFVDFRNIFGDQWAAVILANNH